VARLSKPSASAIRPGSWGKMRHVGGTRTEQRKMTTAREPDQSPWATSKGHRVKSGFTAAAECLALGLAVGSAGIPISFLGALFFFSLRDLGILLLLFLIPLGAICTWWVTRKYLAHETNRFRGAVAFACRYFFLGSFLGFMLAGCACSVASTTFLGGSIGALIGGVGGAFQGWIDERRRSSA
jgi:hypothetical protein